MFPKYIMDTQKKRFLTWGEVLKINYVDIPQKDLLDSIKEFLSLIEGPDKNWNIPTKLQQEFLNEINPFHYHIYKLKILSLNSYLQKNL